MAIVSLFGISSCNVLDQDPVDSFNEESLFQDVNLVEAFLYQCYDAIGGSGSNVLGMREDLLSSSTDELLNIHRAGNVTFTKGTLSPSYLGQFGDAVDSRLSWITWSNYSNIKNVNTLLGGIDDVPTTTTVEEAKIKQIKAEAYFIRAFNYTNLLRSYGGVVIVDKTFNLDDDFSTPTRATLQATVDFILSDLDKAIADLPLKTDIEQGRATKGAAAALKSRLLSFVAGKLTNGGYESTNALVSFQSGNINDRLLAAKNAAKDIIDGKYGTYALAGTTDDPPSTLSDEEFQAYVDNYTDLFLQKGAWNDEVIFGVQYLNKQGNSANNNLYWGPNGYSCWGNNEPIEDLVRQFEMKDGTPFKWDKYTPGENYVRAVTQAQLTSDPEYNPYNGREPRFYATVLYDGAPWRDRASTENKVQIGSKIAAAGSSLVGKSVTDIMSTIKKNVEEDGTWTMTGGEDSRDAAKQAWNGTKTGYYLRKMLDITIDGEVDNSENAWLEMRYAEVLLDYAEACIELGEVEEGLKAVNQIRNRAGLPDRPVNVSQDQAREWYRHERLIEMLGEGDRWYCIRKWMICGDVLKTFSPLYIYHFNDGVSFYLLNTTTLADERTFINANYWLPISTTEINKAPQLIQNPGY
ncbi:MAG: RagB/SusD family nutrient uptake outer membrane protein [Tannerella sp.]|nr:RagB/SusD family nutrient uptake outer membrane protein [Tannerella sp.]